MVTARKRCRFSRESTFYWGTSNWYSASVKITYIVLCFILLVGFHCGALINDIGSSNWWLVGVDVVFGSQTLLYYFAYASAAIKLKPPKPLPAIPVA